MTKAKSKDKAETAEKPNRDTKDAPLASIIFGGPSQAARFFGRNLNVVFFQGDVGRITDVFINKLGREQCFIHVAQNVWRIDDAGHKKKVAVNWVDFSCYSGLAKFVASQIRVGDRVQVVATLQNVVRGGFKNVQAKAETIWRMESSAVARARQAMRDPENPTISAEDLLSEDALLDDIEYMEPDDRDG